MTTENTTEQTSTPPPVETPAPEKITSKNRQAHGVGALKEFLDSRAAAKVAPVAEKPAASPETAHTAKTEELAEKIEDAGGDAPEQKKGETAKQYEVRLSKALRELRDAQADAVQARKLADTSTAEVKKLQKLLENGKANPLTVLEHLGISYEDLTKGIIDEKYKPSHKNPIPPELAEKIERLEAAEKDREAERAKSQAFAKRSQDVGVVKRHLEDHADKFPLAAACAWAADDVVTRVYGGEGDGDAIPVLEALEESLASNVATLLESEKATRALIKKNPKLKELLTAALGVTVAAKSTDDKPVKTVAGSPTEAPARGKMSREEQKRQATADLAEFMRKGE